MALPTDSSETFLREVDENLRRDQLRDFSRRYGRWVVAGIVLFLAAVAGWIYWQQRQSDRSAEHSEQLAQIYTDIGANRLQTVPQRLDTLAAEGGDIVRASALFTRAALAIQQNDRARAIATYKQIAADDSLPQPYRDLAVIRGTSMEFDAIKPEQVVARLQPLAKSGEPWFGSAGELTAMAYLKQGKKAEAARLFATIAADRQVPETLRTRAVQIASTLGVDASASLPDLDR